MRLDTSVKRKAELCSRLFSLWHEAKVCQLSHTEVMNRRLDLLATYPELPYWVHSYLQGVDHTLSVVHQENLEFCYIYNGMLYSTNRQTTKRSTEFFYSNKLGLVLSKCKCGFYYKTSDKQWS